MDLQRLPVDLVEILNKITPNEDEQKKFGQFVKDKKNPKSLPDNDRFLFEVCLIIHAVVLLTSGLHLGGGDIPPPPPPRHFDKKYFRAT